MATVTFQGNICNLAGNEVNVGDNAPEIVVVNSDGLSDKLVGGAKENVQLLITVPSLDTPVCAAETKKFNEKTAAINGIETTVVSMDLPFAAGRYCTAQGIKNLTVASDFRNKDFSNAYGVLIKDSALAGITCRAIFIIDKDGKIVYKEIVSEITEEPNYEAALKVLQTTV